MGLLLATPALATVRVDEDGVSKGYVKNLDFQNGPSITKTGINAAIDYDGAFDADYLRLNGTNTPSADYSWTTDLETTGSVTAEHLHSTDDASITNDITVGGNAVITTTGRVIFDAP